MQEQENMPEETGEVAGDVGEPGQSEVGGEADPAETKKSKKSKSGFDPSKPYGTVHGGSPAIYFQNDKFYNSSGQEVEI